jgi:hypothetical protein
VFQQDEDSKELIIKIFVVITLVPFHYLTSIAIGMKAQLERRKISLTNSQFTVLSSKFSLFNAHAMILDTAIAVPSFTP